MKMDRYQIVIYYFLFREFSRLSDLNKKGNEFLLQTIIKSMWNYECI